MENKSNTTFRISFGKSSSQNYQKAVRLLKRFNNYSLIDEEGIKNEIILKDNELIDQYNNLHSLLSFINGWKTCEIYINDQKADLNEINRFFAESCG